MFTIEQLLADFEKYLHKYPKRPGEAPLSLKADIDDTYHTVTLQTLPVSIPPAAVFERIGFGHALSVSSVKAALEGLPNKNIGVVVDSGMTRYEVVGVAVDKKQSLILLTQKSM
jgi:hypothetical protein